MTSRPSMFEQMLITNLTSESSPLQYIKIWKVDQNVPQLRGGSSIGVHGTIDTRACQHTSK